ncbi:MAG: HEPN domain-containing protein [Desulfobacterota bacterium]|nr:HEPN domain-containing protein [Thermodesulfobacteriota bacterium]
MSDEKRGWLAYAEENIKAAEILLQENLFNACLQNSQQAVEKTLKALLIWKNLPLKKTHSIQELVLTLQKTAVQ